MVFFYNEEPNIMIKRINNTKTIAEDDPQLVIIFLLQSILWQYKKYVMISIIFIAFKKLFCYDIHC